MRSWTYKEITDSADQTIRNMSGNDPFMKRAAWGVYWAWYCLTVGWQEDGDNERIESLANGKEKP